MISRSSLVLSLGAALVLPACAPQSAETPAAAPTDAAAQQGPPYEDKPVALAHDERAAYEAAIRPYVEEARRTYPEARERVRAGLPAGDLFYVTTGLRDSRGNYEQVYVAVEAFVPGEGGGPEAVRGTIDSELHGLDGYRTGQEVTVQEADVIDWTIVHADGTEEGNAVGRFLDTYQPGT